MNQNDIDTLADAVRAFGKDKKYIVTFGASTILITVLHCSYYYYLLGEVWSDGTRSVIKTFNGFELKE